MRYLDPHTSCVVLIVNERLRITDEELMWGMCNYKGWSQTIMIKDDMSRTIHK